MRICQVQHYVAAMNTYLVGAGGTRRSLEYEGKVYDARGGM